MTGTTLFLGGVVLLAGAALLTPSSARAAGPGHGLGTGAQLTDVLKPLEEQDWPEEEKLLAASPLMRLPELLAGLRTQGWQPKVAYTWRTIKSQDHLLAKHYTRVPFSLHMNVGDQGEPSALAADVFDVRYGWGDRSADQRVAAARFFRALGAQAGALGLDWGGRFSQPADSVWTAHNLGWDPGHVEVKNGGARIREFRDASLPRLLGPGMVYDGSGGYRYRVWLKGPYVQILSGALGASPCKDLLLPSVCASKIRAILAESGLSVDFA